MVRLWASTFIVVILAALLGPVYSHHFAERQPFHAHLHIAHAALPHTHPYEVPHSHDAPHNQHSASHQSCAFLPSDAAAGAESGLANWLPACASSSVVTLGDHSLTFIPTRQGTLPPGTSVPPPKPPPRAAL